MIAKLPNGNDELAKYEFFSGVDFIVTDLDGTLTVGSASVLEQIREKACRLRRKHVYMTIATGRPYEGARRLLDELGVEDGMPIALYNGALVMEYNRDNLLASCIIPFEETEYIVSLVGLCGAGVYIYTFDILMDAFTPAASDSRISEQIYYQGERHVEIDVNGIRVQPMDICSLRKRSVFSILVVRNELSKDVYVNLMKYLDDNQRITYTDSGNGFVEIKGSFQNKGIIIEELKKRADLGKINTQRILAIGDNDNDLDLFRAADISVAVANASEAAIDQADFVCENENAKGFLDMLTVIELAKRYF